MVTAEQVSETKSLPQGTSAQLAELVALTRALELHKGQRVKGKEYVKGKDSEAGKR